MFSLEELLAFGKTFGDEVQNLTSLDSFDFLESNFYAGDQVDLLVGVNPDLLVEEQSLTSPSQQISALLKNAGINKSPSQIVDFNEGFGFVASLTKYEANALSNIKGITSFDIPSTYNVEISSTSAAASFSNEIGNLTNDVVYGVQNSAASLNLDSDKWEVYLPQYWVGEEISGDLDSVSGFAQVDLNPSDNVIYSNGTSVSKDTLPYGVKAVWSGKDVTDLTGAKDADGNEIGDGKSDYDANGVALSSGGQSGKDYTGYYAFVIDSGCLVLENSDLNLSGKASSANGLSDADKASKSWSKSFVSGVTDPFVDTNGHGTHVSGTIAAKANGKGVVGVAPGATIVSIKVFGNGGAAFSTITDAVKYVGDIIIGAGLNKDKTVVNMSLGGGFSASLNNMIATYANQGVNFAVAAGNSSMDVDNVSPASSGDLANVYTVSAVNNKYKMASWSNYDSLDGNNATDDVDVAGPGVAVKSYYKGGGTAYLSGTSMAAPAVAGLLLAGDGKIKKGAMVTPNSKGWADPFALQNEQLAQDTPGSDTPPDEKKPPAKSPAKDDPANLDFDNFVDGSGAIIKDGEIQYKAYGSFEGANGTYALSTNKGSFTQSQLEGVLGIVGGTLDGEIAQAGSDKVGINFAPKIPSVAKSAINATEGSGANVKGYAEVGDILTFDYAFASNDYSPYNDFSFFTLGANTYTLAAIGGLSKGGGVPDNGSQNGTAEIVLSASDFFVVDGKDADGKYKYKSGTEANGGVQGGLFNFSVGVVDAIDTCVSSSLLVKELNILGKDEKKEEKVNDVTKLGDELLYASYGDYKITGGGSKSLSVSGIAAGNNFTAADDKNGINFELSTGQKNTSKGPILQGIMEFNLGLSSNILDSDLSGTTTAIDATEGSAVSALGFGKVGDKVSFSYDFNTNDYAPYKDFSWYSVNGKVKKIAKVGEDTEDFGWSSGNIEYTLTADDFKTDSDPTKTQGDVQLNMGVMDVKDWCVSSDLEVFNIVIGDKGFVKAKEKTSDELKQDIGDKGGFAFSAAGNSTGFNSSTGNVVISNASGSLQQNQIEKQLGLKAKTLDGTLNNTKPGINATEGSFLKATGVASVGDQISFDYNFETNDYSPFNDFSFYSVGGKAYKVATLGKDFSGNVDVPNKGASEFNTASYVFSSSDFGGAEFGAYTFGIGVMDALDTGVDSKMTIENIQYLEAKDADNKVEETDDKKAALVKFGKVGGNASGSKETGFLLTNGGTGGASSQSQLESGLSLNLGSLDKQMAGWGNNLKGSAWTKNATNATEGAGLWAVGSAKVGDKASFKFKFDTNDYTPYADYAFYGLSTKQASESVYENKKLTALAAIGQNVNNYNKDTTLIGGKAQAWKEVDYTFKAGDFGGSGSGEYKFSWGVVDVKDTCVTSSLYVNSFALTPQGEAAGLSGFNVNSFGNIDGVISASKEEIDPQIEEFGNAFADMNTEVATMSTGDGSIAQIFLEDQLGLESGVLDKVGGNATEGSACKGSVEAAVGDIVTFKYNMWTNDYIPYQDFAFYSINGNVKKIAEVGTDLDSFDSTTGIINYTISETDFKSGSDSGFVDIVIGILDVKDTEVDSYLEISDFSVGGDANEQELASMGIASGSELTQLVDASGNLVKFTLDGTVVGEDYSNTWNVAGANDTGAGFDVILEGTGSKKGSFKYLTTDASGNTKTQGDWVTTEDAIKAGYEELIDVDLNSNGFIEQEPGLSNNLKVYNTGTGLLTLTEIDSGKQKDIAESSNFSILVATEANPDMGMFSGEKVTNILVEGKGANANKWQAWQANSSGNIGKKADDASSWKTQSDAISEGYETKFKYDLDKNGLIEGGTNYQLAGEKGKSFVLKNEKGIVYNDDTSSDWNAFKASSSVDGFDILLKGEGTYADKFQVVKANTFGVFTKEFSDWLSMDELLSGGFEKTFGDLNGDAETDFYSSIESLGKISLKKGASGAYYALDGTYKSITFNKNHVTDQTFKGSGWNLVAVEGNKLLWSNSKSNALSVWTVDSDYNFDGKSYSQYIAGSKAALEQEAIFGVDGDNDGLVGFASKSVDTQGAVKAFTTYAKTVFIEDSDGNKIDLKNQSKVVSSQLGPWKFQAADTFDKVNKVLWSNSSTGDLTTWNVDSNWDWDGVSYEKAEKGSDEWFTTEVDWNLDTNKDTIIGGSGTAQIFTDGVAALVQSANGELSVGAKKLSSTNGLIDVYDFSALGWNPIAASKINNVETLVWANNLSKKVSVWEYNTGWSSLKNFNAYDFDSKKNIDIETAFKKDIDGDGVVGAFYDTIESKGSLTLYKDQNEKAYLKVGSDYVSISAPGGGELDASAYANWTLKGAETTNNGNQLVWQNTNKDLGLWTLDSNWNFKSAVIVKKTGYEFGLIEKNFLQNLDDNVIVGSSTSDLFSASSNIKSTIEQQGSVELLTDNTSKVFVKLGDISTAVKFSGADLLTSDSKFGAWTLKGAETVSNGTNQLVWENNLSKNLSVWSLDDTWNYKSYSFATKGTGDYAAVEQNLKLDLDEDGLIGSTKTLVEESGGTALYVDKFNQAFAFSNSEYNDITFNGSLVNTKGIAGWSLKAAENVGGVNKVLWQQDSTSSFAVWSCNDKWIHQKSDFLASTQLLALESDFVEDLNANGVLGS